jgi:hypothetical protein
MSLLPLFPVAAGVLNLLLFNVYIAKVMLLFECTKYYTRKFYKNVRFLVLFLFSKHNKPHFANSEFAKWGINGY